jgi:hypothetical protein
MSHKNDAAEEPVIFCERERAPRRHYFVRRDPDGTLVYGCHGCASRRAYGRVEVRSRTRAGSVAA